MAYEARRLAAKNRHAGFGGGQAGQLERPLGNESVEKDESPARSSARTIVRIKSCRVRLLDKDNLYGGAKPYVDALRYAGAIQNDSPDAIDLEITQEKVTQEKVKTIIEIENL